MAEAIVSVVMDQLGSIIRRELEQEVRLVVGVRKEAKNLKTTLTIIKAVLEDAEVKQLRNGAVKLWLMELKNIAYDADDILDEWCTRILMSQSQSQINGVTTDGSLIATTDGSRIANKVLSYLSFPCSCFQSVAVKHDIALRIKDIRERLDVVSRDKDHLNLIENRSHEEPRQVTSSIVDVSEVHGRDADKEIIVSKLLCESSQQIHVHVPVISVVGTGGFGKTTLAQLILKEETVMDSFELKMWVCVSEPCDLGRIAKDIIQQATGEKPDVIGWEALHQSLCRSVRGKHFLLILDDVWTKDYNLWNPLKLSLDGGARGSKIIVTTRDEGVAKMMGSTYIHSLPILSDDYCWSIFRQIAFYGRSQEELERLEETGMEIAKKCKGVPLAVKTIASLMRFKQTRHDWRNVLESEMWEMQLENGFFPALLLSYHALPSFLKQCFLYCAMFPKDEKLEKDRLVKLWMAQGFLGAEPDGGKELEMIGGGYFDDLAMRSFFQDFEKDDHGSIVKCKMHDLVHDFSQFLTVTQCYNIDKYETEMSSDEARHVNIWTNEYFKSPSIYKMKNLRTLMLCTVVSELPELFSRLTNLRALDLTSSILVEPSNELGRLLHLRYLDFSDTKFERLPETICNLYNLQTLKLVHCTRLCELPERFGEVSNLRHLETERSNNLKYFPRRFGKLSHLRTLRRFIVSSSRGGCSLGELKNLNHLKGDLEIAGLRQVENVNEAEQAELRQKKNLRTLNLQFGYFRPTIEEEIGEDDKKRMEGVAEGLQPHNNLEKLVIYGYPGLRFPSWMSSESLLSNIVDLRLERCKLCTRLPALGKLQSLETLYIEDLASVKQIGDGFYGSGVATSNEDTSFPKLKTLTVRHMEELEAWEIPFSKFKKIMPRLCSLMIWRCAKLTRLPPLGSLESLETINIYGLSSIKCVGVEFLGISDDYEECKRIIGSGEESSQQQEQQQQIIFPRLRELTFEYMEKWEEWDLPLLSRKDRVQIMPHLRNLEIKCTMLKNLPALAKLKLLDQVGRKLNPSLLQQHLPQTL